MRSTPVKIIIYGLMALSGLTAAYTLLTNGSQTSLLRAVFPDPRWDFYIAVGSSLLFFILCFIPFQIGQDSTFRKVVEMNAENIRTHRENGWSDEDIAVSMLDAMNVRPGIKRDVSRKKLVFYLSQFR